MIYFGVSILFLVGVWLGVLITWHWPHRCCMLTIEQEKEPPQPTIAREAMERESNARRLIGNAMMDRILSVTTVRNEHGLPHVDVEEMDQLCNDVEMAALDIIGTWGAGSAGQGR